MSHWNLKRAARFGYLAGRSLSIESIIADDVVAARSERRALRGKPTCKGSAPSWKRNASSSSNRWRVGRMVAACGHGFAIWMDTSSNWRNTRRVASIRDVGVVVGLRI